MPPRQRTNSVTRASELAFNAQQAERPVSGLPSREDERRLIQRAKQDPNAFGELYDRYFHQIYRFVYSRVKEQAGAEDVTSEVFMKALRGMPRFVDTGRPFSAWLYQIAVNAIADRYRSRRVMEDVDEMRSISTGEAPLDEM